MGDRKRNKSDSQALHLNDLDIGFQLDCDNYNTQCLHPKIWKNGYTRDGRTKTKCAICGRSFTQGKVEKNAILDNAKILFDAYLSGRDYKKAVRLSGLHATTVYRAFDKFEELGLTAARPRGLKAYFAELPEHDKREFFARRERLRHASYMRNRAQREAANRVQNGFGLLEKS